jgi:hypothetical protein
MKTKTIKTANNNQESQTRASQTEIGRALGVNQATVSRQFRLGTVNPLKTMMVSDEAVKE